MAEIQFIDHAPRVFVVGITMSQPNEILEYLKYRGETWNTEGDIILSPEAVVEAAGRVCYQSWKNPANRSREEYLQEQIVGHAHGSVLEHLTINFLCADVPRSTQLETVRHRAGMAYSWESTRFTDKHMRFVIPPRFRGDKFAEIAFKSRCSDAAHTYRTLVDQAARDTDEGTLKRKRAKEAARSILPNALGSDGMFTCNARSLRHFIEIRTSEHADLSIREFAYAIYQAAKPWVPSILADAVETPAEGTPSVSFAVSKV